jgi:hypothetical protein
MKALRALGVVLLLFAALHSAGQASFRIAVGGIGLVFVGASDDETPRTESDRAWQAHTAEPRALMKVELFIGAFFAVLAVLELANAVVVGIGKPSRAAVVFGLLSLAGAALRASQIPDERARDARKRAEEATAFERGFGAEPKPSHPSFYGIGVSHGPGDYAMSALHALAGFVAVGVGVSLLRRPREIAAPPL